MNSSDAELLHAWAAGDSAAGTMLFRRHYEALYRFLRSKVDADLEDLIQTTMLACLEALPRFAETSSFKTFLFAIARHKVFHHYRRRTGVTADVSELSVESLSDSPSRVAARREEERLLLLALRGVPLDYQIVLELHYWEGMTVAEIGEVLQEPDGTVKSRLHRGRLLLRREIERRASTPELAESTLGNLTAWAEGVREVLQS
jgi:RNA polymerase sigma factor (sigma-70 family)